MSHSRTFNTKMDENPKLKNSNPKTKEKRSSNPQNENPPKKNVKAPGPSKFDLSQLTAPQNFDVNSSVKRIFNEANKIVKIGMEKEFALQEKNQTLQSSNETIDNLRKNILHLQMEYEKLDQNYQREISTRSEIIKRMDSSRDIVESMVQYSNTLASSIKLLEDDKCRIVEYYELIYQGQKEIEAKHVEAAKFIKEIDYLIKSKIEDLRNSYDRTLSQNTETISQLNKNLSYAADKLQIFEDENEKLQIEIKELQETTIKMEASLQNQQNLNNIHQKAIFKLKLNVKKLKICRLKYQKLLKIKNKTISNLINSNNTQRKNLENMKELLEKSISANKILESKNNAWEIKFENQLREEALQNQNWEAQIAELRDKIKVFEMECEELKIKNEILNEKLLELTKNEEKKQKEIEELQTDLSKILSSNLNLQEDLKNLNDETTRKENKISDLEAKISELTCKINSDAIFYQNETKTFQELVKKFENQLSDAEKKLHLEKNQKEILLSDYNSKLENLKVANEKVNNLEKLLEDKEAYIKEVELQQKSISLDGKKTLEKLNKEIQAQRAANKELNSDHKNLESSYSAVKKELQEAKNKISDLEEKLNEEKSLNKELKGIKNELEKNIAVLKKELECQKYSLQELQEKHIKAENELKEMRKAVEENDSLKLTVADLKNSLKTTEARVEAYKVVVKKLETEKAEIKCSQVEEVSKLRLELSRPDEAARKTPEFSKMTTSHRNVEQMENEPQATEIEKWHETPSTPVQDSKKFLTTPRKIFTSTPQPSSRNLTPFKKKRNPYEFDSDSSVERFDPEQVLKVFRRQKKETNKKSKTNK